MLRSIVIVLNPEAVERKSVRRLRSGLTIYWWPNYVCAYERAVLSGHRPWGRERPGHGRSLGWEAHATRRVAPLSQWSGGDRQQPPLGCPAALVRNPERLEHCRAPI